MFDLDSMLHCSPGGNKLNNDTEQYPSTQTLAKFNQTPTDIWIAKVAFPLASKVFSLTLISY